MRGQLTFPYCDTKAFSMKPAPLHSRWIVTSVASSTLLQLPAQPLLGFFSPLQLAIVLSSPFPTPPSPTKHKQSHNEPENTRQHEYHFKPHMHTIYLIPSLLILHSTSSNYPQQQKQELIRHRSIRCTAHPSAEIHSHTTTKTTCHHLPACHVQ